MSAVSPAAPTVQAAALYERHRIRVLRFCQSRLGSREEAEDATQTTFLNAVGALRRGTVPRSEAAWLLRIAENVCHGRHRTASRRHESACDPTVLADVVEDPHGRPDELIHLPAALEAMPERQRRALLLREWQGLSYDEIGVELGLSHSAVETLLFRARRALARSLEAGGRRGLGLAAWVKAAVGGGAALKVAAAVVVTGVAVLPAAGDPRARADTRNAPVRAQTPDASPSTPAAARQSPLYQAPPPPTTSAPLRRDTGRAVHGGRAPALDGPPAGDAAPAPAPAPKPAGHTPAPAPRAPGATQPAPQPETPTLQVPTVEVPPVQIPPVQVPPIQVPGLPEVVVPEVSVPPVQVPPITVPPLPQVEDVVEALPPVQVPELPLPGLP